VVPPAGLSFSRPGAGRRVKAPSSYQVNMQICILTGALERAVGPRTGHLANGGRGVSRNRALTTPPNRSKRPVSQGQKISTRTKGSCTIRPETTAQNSTKCNLSLAQFIEPPGCLCARGHFVPSPRRRPTEVNAAGTADLVGGCTSARVKARKEEMTRKLVIPRQGQLICRGARSFRDEHAVIATP
jgi:hypothetical protein